MGLGFLVCETEIVNPNHMGSLGGFRDISGPRVLAQCAYSKCLINASSCFLPGEGGVEGLLKEIQSFSAVSFLHVAPFKKEE